MSSRLRAHGSSPQWSWIIAAQQGHLPFLSLGHHDKWARLWAEALREAEALKNGQGGNAQNFYFELFKIVSFVLKQSI